LGLVQEFQLNLGQMRKASKFYQFVTASFNCGQLQTVLFKDGLYRKAPLKF